MHIRPIHTADDHRAALQLIEQLWGADPGTEEGDALDVLATLVERYEEEHFPLPDADPVAVLQAAMDERGFSQSDLAEVLGSRSRASEILSGRRPLALEHIRRIHHAWKVPADLLIGAPELAHA
jgi:HTH-type transcriptional regulator/antitoxin HigA